LSHRVTQRATAVHRRRDAARNTLDLLFYPSDSLAQAIYSILLVLTFTLADRVAEGDEVLSTQTGFGWASQLLLASFGCAVAWGLIDGIMYLLSSRFEREQQRHTMQQIQQISSEDEGVRAIAEELEDAYPLLASMPDRQQLYRALYSRRTVPLPAPPRRLREDLLGALGTVLVAVGAALPMMLPLVLFADNPELAVRLSNVVACSMLFWLGYRWAAYAGGRKWRTGLQLLVLGLVMVGIAIPLGG
jgi:VIT1/CCC1 family predicted Fe2+/Mn2+ transporter